MEDNNPTFEPQLPEEIAVAFRTDARGRAERTEEFWARQQIRIRSNIASYRRPRVGAFVLALGAAGGLLLAALVAAPARHDLPGQQVTADADQELLLSVEHALAMGTPEALEPLTLLVESSSGVHATDPNTYKEHRNED